MKNLKKKIRELFNDNPDLRSLLTEKFPEIIKDETPYAMKGTIFMKHAYCRNLYMVGYSYSSGYFYIRNCTDDTIWSGTKKPSNDSCYGTPYLNEYDFNTLLKTSMCSISNIVRLDGEDLKKIHEKHVKYFDIRK